MGILPMWGDAANTTVLAQTQPEITLASFHGRRPLVHIACSAPHKVFTFLEQQVKTTPSTPVGISWGFPVEGLCALVPYLPPGTADRHSWKCLPCSNLRGPAGPDSWGTTRHSLGADAPAGIPVSRLGAT